MGGEWAGSGCRVALVLLGCLLGAGSGSSAGDAARTNGGAKPVLVEVRKIWDRAPHNAFTDLLRFQDRWYCVFREGAAHVSPDGALRVITSADGRHWQSAALIRSPVADLRDAKISRTPDGRLMLSGAAAYHGEKPYRHQSMAWFSKDGREWSGPASMGDPDMWLWRVTWRDDTAYSIGYHTNKDRSRRFLRLYCSRDGKRFETLADRIIDAESPGEHSLWFEKDGTALCLLRRDAGTATAQLGRAEPPYREWTWKDLGVRIGGPHFTRLPDGRFVAVVRLYDGRQRTSLCRLDPENAKLEELLTLPSGGDTSYAGLVWHDDRLWVSYYSSHEKKASIYLARIRF